MRVLLKVHFDAEAGSRAIRSGRLPEIMKSTVEQLRPEAAYFAPENGQRTAYLVFDLAEPSQLPAITEPFFAELGAKVECSPVMNLDDVRSGLDEVAKSAQ
jgi:hypothetical protein